MESVAFSGPRPKPLIGNIPDFLATKEKCAYQGLLRLSEKWGSTFKLKMAGKSWYVISDMNLNRELLLRHQNSLVKGSTLAELTHMSKGWRTITELDGDKWQRTRKHFTPEFAKDRINKGLEEIEKVMAEALPGLAKTQTFNALDFTTRLAFRSICQIMLNFKPDCLADLKTPYEHLQRQRFLVDQFMRRVRMGPFWKYLPIPSNWRVRSAVNANEKYFESAIHERRANPNTLEKDFLDILLAYRDENGEPYCQEELIIHVFGLIGAAFESTSAILQWTLYYLSQHSEIQKQAREEILREGEVKPEKIGKYILTQQIISESIRLSPPFPMLVREVTEEIEMAGMKISKDAFVFMLVGAPQRFESIWGQDAAEFKPERFANLTAEQKMSYTPYGIGKRACIGEALARIELPLLLAHLIKNFEFSYPQGEVPKPFLRFAQQSEDKIYLKATPV